MIYSASTYINFSPISLNSDNNCLSLLISRVWDVDCTCKSISKLIDVAVWCELQNTPFEINCTSLGGNCNKLWGKFLIHKYSIFDS